MKLSILMTLLSLALTAGMLVDVAAAQDEARVPETTANSGEPAAPAAAPARAATVPGKATVAELTDFRNYLMFGFSLVFAAIIFYLVASYRQNASLAEEAEFLKGRLRELQK